MSTLTAHPSVSGPRHCWLALLIAFAGVGVQMASAQAPADPFQLPPEEPAPIVDSAAVKAIRSSNPSTPEQLMNAIQMLIELERYDLAGEYLQSLIGQSLDSAALARLHQRFGTADMIRLSRTTQLAPAGTEFASQVLAAADEVAHDSQRIAALVQRLGSDQRETQLRSAADLLRAGSHAVGPLVKAAASSDSERLTKNAQYVLTRLGETAVDPVIAFLSSPDAALRAAAIDALGQIGARHALPYLVRPLLTADSGSDERNAAATAFRRVTGAVPSRRDAISLLTVAATRAFDGETHDQADAEGRITTWTWDEPAQTVVPSRLPKPDVAALAASRLYRDLFWLHPNDHDTLVRYLISKLDFDQVVGGLDDPLRTGAGSGYDLATRAGAATANDVLSVSLDTGHHPAAVGAAQVLGDLDDSSVLHDSGQLSPLARALNDRHRRVRYAASKAIIRMKPAGTFPGASRLADNLGYFASSAGQRGVLVAHPGHQEASQVAGLAAEAGFHSETVHNCSDLLRRAKASPDWEVLFISDALPRTSTWSLVESLRADPQTAEIPIVLMAHLPTGLLPLQNTAESMTRAIAVIEPTEAETVRSALTRALQSAGRAASDPNERLDQAITSLNALNQLVETDERAKAGLGRQQVRLIQALRDRELSGLAAKLLSQIGSTQAQLALADLASQNALPTGQREAAADAFDRSVRSFGVLMTSDEIQRQYDRYNESRHLTTDSHKVLGALLDSIEAR